MEYLHKIVNSQTGEEKIVPYTKEEIIEAQKLHEKANNPKIDYRALALAKLAALGLTEDEIAAL